MLNSVFRFLLVLEFLIYGTICVKISPKLDFGTDDSAGDTASLRGIFHSRSFGNAEREYNQVKEISVACPSGKCDVSDKHSRDGTEVIVHVKTQTSNSKNDSTEIVPDVPIIVGKDPQDFPYYNTPNINSAPPFLIQNGMQDSPFPINSGFGYDPHLFNQVANRNVNSYPIYNAQNPNIDRIPQHQFLWNNQRRIGSNTNYNPVEFKKVYPGFGLPTRQLENGFFTQKSDSFGNLRPCIICPDSEGRYYPTYQ